MSRRRFSAFVVVFFCLFYCIRSLADKCEYSNKVCRSSLMAMAQGAASGTISTCVFAPFGCIQNSVVQKLPIRLHPGYLFTGLPSLIAGKVPTVALQTGLYQGITQSMKSDDQQELSPTQRMMAAGAAGGISAGPDNAARLVALDQQNNYNLATAGNHQKVRKETIRETIARLPGGYKSLGRGYGPSALCQMAFAATYLDGIALAREKIGTITDNETLRTAGSAIAVGGGAALATQPLRVIGTVLHADIERKKYTGMIDAAKKIITTEGASSLWRASGVRSAGVLTSLVVAHETLKGLTKI